jgi:HEAT repeat protein
MRQTVALSLLDRPSASERLLGVSYSSEVAHPTGKTLTALFETLDSDENTNVRLAAVEALYLFRDEPGVKDNLVHSLGVQNAPQVQVALIDLLVEIKERRAIDALKALVAGKLINADVKKRAEQGLKQII